MDGNNSKTRYSSLPPEEKRKVLRRELAEGKLQKWQYKAEMLNIAAEEMEAKGDENAREELTVRNIRKRAAKGRFRWLILTAAVLSAAAATFAVYKAVTLFLAFGLGDAAVAMRAVFAAECVAGSVFAWIGYFAKKRWATLTAAVIFLAGCCFGLTAVCAALAFMGYAAEE